MSDAIPDVVELPDQTGILLRADLAAENSDAIGYFRTYARDVWGWPDRITNIGCDGPHRYCLFPDQPDQPGGWRRSMFSFPELEEARFWKLAVGYVG